MLKELPTILLKYGHPFNWTIFVQSIHNKNTKKQLQNTKREPGTFCLNMGVPYNWYIQFHKLIKSDTIMKCKGSQRQLCFNTGIPILGPYSLNQQTYQEQIAQYKEGASNNLLQYGCPLQMEFTISQIN
jgi:hypothetical protein